MVDHTIPTNGRPTTLQYIDLAFNNDNADDSACALAYKIQPKWRESQGKTEIVKFTDGITNTLLKVAKHVPGHSQTQIDQDSILLRAYGNNTDILIDRDREARSHALCAERGLAPPLLARFKNGLLYRYIIGQVCTPQDLIREPVWRAVAKRLGEWHARLPIDSVSESKVTSNGVNGHDMDGTTDGAAQRDFDNASKMHVPNIWSVIQKWIHALPNDTPKQKARRDLLQHELDRSYKELHNERGPGNHGLVFGHCDLLSANVIMLPKDCSNGLGEDEVKVSFIDYEYATPCAAAFDISNHFAEWGGYDCDYNMLPTKSIRRQFLTDYIDSYRAHSDKPVSDDMVDVLYDEVDKYRGMPGFYWGVWALIQATISQIDFDYASYAEVRLGEYFAWRAEENGSRAKQSVEMPLRERIWANP
ncbi:hypothetical protein PV11_07184 [Exophiala sideris]|uniref:ethanolamine kinase n=1 Tax=Exophiala sideris TaxID=1016849 RepID=A0A0D1YFI2_9EURO|nr:hypothetical protein PV11_07184 [Exophiala sideris]